MLTFHRLSAFIATTLATTLDSQPKLQRLEVLFKKNNKLVHQLDGCDYYVLKSSMCRSVVTDLRGSTFVLKWLKPDGTVDETLADKWALAPDQPYARSFLPMRVAALLKRRESTPARP